MADDREQLLRELRKELLGSVGKFVGVAVGIMSLLAGLWTVFDLGYVQVRQNQQEMALQLSGIRDATSVLPELKTKVIELRVKLDNVERRIEQLEARGREE